MLHKWQATVAFPLIAAGLIHASCFIPGPAFPRPKLRTADASLKPLIGKLDALVEDILSHSQDPSSPWEVNKTSFSLHLTSGQETLWTSHHTASILGEYIDSQPTNVTGDTVFRIASVTKVFTIYALLLQQKPHWDDPITDFIPELSGSSTDDKISWHDITLRSLGSHLSGIMMNYGADDLGGPLDIDQNPLDLGFPPVSPKELPPCGMLTESHPACTRGELLSGIKKRQPIFAPNDRSSYSNVEYTLLGIALANITGQSYEDSIARAITSPLGMHRTGFIKPKDENGIIPVVDNAWSIDEKVDNPSGGLYSSGNDLDIILRSILNSELLSVAKTNIWLKPQSFTSDLNSGYGMPWEILRTTKLSADGRAIDIFHKAGGLPGYYSAIMLVPEFNVGLTLLYAGNWQPVQLFKESFLKVVGEEVERIVRTDAKKKYSGFYAARSTVNSSLELDIDSGPGIRVMSWISNGTDFLSSYRRLKAPEWARPDSEIRLIPTGLKYGDDTEVWRVTTSSPKLVGSVHLFDDFCMPHLDFLTYYSKPADEFVFKFVDGKVDRVQLTGMRIQLARKDDLESIITGAQLDDIQAVFRAEL